MEKRISKPRAWLKEAKEMISVDSIYYDAFGGFEITGGGYYDMDHLEVVLIQPTGLHDKNGKEIYEGDILNCISCYDLFYGVIRSGNYEYAPDSESYVQQHTGFYIELRTPKGIAIYPIDGANKNSSVIGNIYENPELITPAPSGAE